MTTPFEDVKEFHHHFDPNKEDKVAPLTSEEANYRAGFQLEEIIEFLYAAADGNQSLFNDSISYLQTMLKKEAKALCDANKPVDPLVDEADALIDLLYFTYGSFVKMGVDPTPLFHIVHQANMGKLFPDGKPHYHPETGKVLKPKHWQKDYAPEEKIKEAIKKQLN